MTTISIHDYVGKNVVPKVALHRSFKKALEGVIIKRFDEEFAPNTLTDAQRKRCHDEIMLMVVEWVTIEIVMVTSLFDLETKVSEFFHETRSKFIVK